jgi:hypothetical protein
MYVLYDGRARGGNTERAAVIVTADSEGEALHISCSYRDYDAVWYEYDIPQQGVLTNERERYDLARLLFL